MDFPIRFQPIDTLIAYARNSRTHSDEQVGQIAASIVEFGFTNPVLADGTSIVAGHGRVLGARKVYASGQAIRLPNGQEIPRGTVPVIDCTGWSEAQRRAYVIADNQLALNAGWDMDLLRVEVGDLKMEGFNLEILGFDADFLAGLQLDVQETGLPELGGDREPIQQMTFTLHDDQADLVKRAIDAAHDLGDYDEALNTNKNGNALARICEAFLAQQGMA